MFPTSIDKILNKVDAIDPVAYGSNRNFLSGAVTRLSPYISRGVLSTKFIAEFILNKGYEPKKIEVFLKELVWRDYWQQIWIAKGSQIDNDLNQKQPKGLNEGIPKNILLGKTSIEAIDNAILEFYETGYMHNHMRMYIASITTNIGQYKWNYPAKWMYYHLLDGDWASNALSWQWVAGSSSKKAYIANQENINKYCHSQQTNTFLDHSYEALAKIEIPNELKLSSNQELITPLPSKGKINVDPNKISLIYTYYNLDPLWRNNEDYNKILILEPSTFKAYPTGKKALQFCIDLSKNINNIQIYVGEFKDLKKEYNLTKFIFKEHPFCNHFDGIKDQRDWISPSTDYYDSFFKYWKQVKKSRGW